MNKNVLMVIGLVDYVLDTVNTPDQEYAQTRTALLANISIKLSAVLMENPKVMREFGNIQAEIKPEMPITQLTDILSKYFTQVEMPELDISQPLNGIVKSVLAEFIDKVAPENRSLVQVIDTAFS